MCCSTPCLFAMGRIRLQPRSPDADRLSLAPHAKPHVRQGQSLLSASRGIFAALGVVGGLVHQTPIHGIALPMDLVKRRQ